MRIPNLRTFAIVLAAGIGLGGCVSPLGYGSGVSVGYGNQGYYDPYYDSYGYGSPYGYGYSRYGGYGGYGGYGAGYGYAPYWGWNDGYYYPGSGYYVYDQYRRPRVMTDAERQYWTERATSTDRTRTGKLLDNWADFSKGGQAASQGTQGTQTTRAVRSSDSTLQDLRAARRAMRVERSSRAPAEPRQSTRSERRFESRSPSSESTGGRRASVRGNVAEQPE